MKSMTSWPKKKCVSSGIPVFSPLKWDPLSSLGMCPLETYVLYHCHTIPLCAIMYFCFVNFLNWISICIASHLVITWLFDSS